MERTLAGVVKAMLLTATFSLMFGLAFRADAKKEVLSKYRVYAVSAETMQKIAESFEVTSREGSSYDVIVPESLAATFKTLAPNAEVVEADIAGEVKKALRSFEPRDARSRGLSLPVLEDFFPSVRPERAPSTRYRSFDEVLAWIRAHVDAQPGLVSVHQYGTSTGGRPLYAMKITGNGRASSEQAKPHLMLTAATHGDELITVEVLMELIDRLIAGYGVDARFTEMLNRRVLHVIPVVNPDGFVNRDRYDGGKDPNRSYPYPGRENNRPTDSIRAVMDFFNQHDIKGSIDFHAHGGLIIYPWGYTTQSPQRIPPVEQARLNLFENLAGRMAGFNGYRHGQISRILYPAPGSSADYYYWKKGTLSLGVEIGRSKVPNPREFAQYVASQLESTWTFIENF